MAQRATLHRFVIDVSDVDRGVYEQLDFRVARHPSESMRYLLTRTLAYCLSYENGIVFSKGGVSSVDEAPVSVSDAGGKLLSWIDIGMPSAERLHKAAKAAHCVALYTYGDVGQLRRQVASRTVHRIDAIEVYRVDPGFLDALAEQIQAMTRLELVRNDGHIYVSILGRTWDTPLKRTSLAPE
jgi:uncharacterized protein YaeQ